MAVCVVDGKSYSSGKSVVRTFNRYGGEVSRRIKQFKETKYGFIWNAAEVQRVYEETNGSIDMTIQTPRTEINIYVTPTGLIRVFNKKGELEPPKEVR